MNIPPPPTIIGNPTASNWTRDGFGRYSDSDKISSQAANIPRLVAPTIGISVDYRRQNLSEESLTRNVERLKAYRSRLVLFPKKGKGKRPEVPENSVARLTHALPFTAVAAAVTEIKKSDIPKSDESAYTKLRKARSDARLVGVREKRAKEKAEAEANKK